MLDIYFSNPDEELNKKSKETDLETSI